MTIRTMLLSSGLALLGGVAHAADPGAAASALKVLTSTQDSTSTAPVAAPARESLVLQRSETLDALIRRHYAGWPFKDEVFRRALADLNPGAVPNAANNLIKRGSTLMMPTAEDLRRTVQQHYPKAADLVRIRVEVETEELAARSGNPSGPPGADRRRWVRFP